MHLTSRSACRLLKVLNRAINSLLIGLNTFLFLLAPNYIHHLTLFSLLQLLWQQMDGTLQ